MLCSRLSGLASLGACGITSPPAQGISTKDMIGYLVYWIVQFPLLCVRPDRVRWVFVVKSVLVPVAWVAILVWALVVQHSVVVVVVVGDDDDGALFRDRAEVPWVEVFLVFSGQYDFGFGELCHHQCEPGAS